MKKISFLIAVFAGIAGLSAQPKFDSSDMRCTYRLSYYPDSTDKEKTLSEDVLLFIKNKNSFFESANVFYDDSIDLNNVRIDASFRFSNFRNMIFKREDTITDIEIIENTYYLYKEPDKINWSIKNDAMLIDKYNCQKAICNFGGREWIAWFTTDLPVSDGLYKFCGLPGLIVQIQDAHNNFNFKLIENKFKKEKIYSTLYAFDFKKTILETSKKKYFKTLSAYRHNPMFFVNQRKDMKITSGADQIEKNIKNNLQKHNNLLEINQ